MRLIGLLAVVVGLSGCMSLPTPTEDTYNALGEGYGGLYGCFDKIEPKDYARYKYVADYAKTTWAYIDEAKLKRFTDMHSKQYRDNPKNCDFYIRTMESGYLEISKYKAANQPVAPTKQKSGGTEYCNYIGNQRICRTY